MQEIAAVQEITTAKEKEKEKSEKIEPTETTAPPSEESTTQENTMQEPITEPEKIANEQPTTVHQVPQTEPQPTPTIPKETAAPEPVTNVIILSEQFEIEPNTEAFPDIPNIPDNDSQETPETEIVSVVEKESDNSITEVKESNDVDDKNKKTKPSDKGGALGIIIDLYVNILSEGQGELYECQKGYIYFETVEEYKTVNRTSPEHTLILESGGYNVAEKLRDEALTVEADWVIRKNPTLIVKCVAADLLGEGVTDTAAAAELRDDIFSRSGWNGINAVIERNVLLLSSQLFSTAEGRLIAKLYIARAMYPELFSETDITEFYQQITEGGGMDFTNGIYVY